MSKQVLTPSELAIVCRVVHSRLEDLEHQLSQLSAPEPERDLFGEPLRPAPLAAAHISDLSSRLSHERDVLLKFLSFFE